MKREDVEYRLCQKLTKARGIITLAHDYADADEMLQFSLEAALDLLEEVESLASKLETTN